MASYTNLDKGPLHHLPVELIREIGSKLATPRELVNFACICSRTNAAIGVVEMAMADIMFQSIETDPKPRVFRFHGPEELYSGNNNGDNSDDSNDDTNDDLLRPHKPILIYAIETGKDIDYIKQCINVYKKNFTDALEGYWYPLRRDLDKYNDRYAQFPSPMFAAAKAGRLDVMQALAECHVSMRGWMNLHKGWKVVRNSEDPINGMIGDEKKGGNAFSAACESKNEYIALWMISNGLWVEWSDIRVAARFGCFQVLETLLNHPDFVHFKRRDAILQIAKWTISSFVADPEIILPLLDDVFHLDADKDEFIQNEIIHRLVRPRPTAENALRMSRVVDFYANWAKPPISGRNIAWAAAFHKIYLDIVKAIISGERWSLGESEEERAEAMDEMFWRAREFESSATVKYLVSLGYKIPSSEHHVHWIAAILGLQPE
ncbi:hypothetical protein F5Y13DRAFT_202757 [Hypoxylon sp. FL1857]|nr:hypothetical protein F5Y13DRAFT_202757 [Hypoxylon sp. FL1857]